MVLVVILILIFAVLGFCWLMQYWLNKRYLLSNFRKKNVIVFGKKGSGKDLLFQYVIEKRDDPYYSNTDYGGDYEYIRVKDVSVEPNRYNEMLEDNIQIIDLKQKQNTDIYISDGGIYLPSYMDSKLYKEYPSLPIYYAVIRHLTNSNIHINTQNLERVWKALREQADFYVKVEKTTKLPGKWFIVHWVSYERYADAQAELKPLKMPLIRKADEKDIAQSERGEIKQGISIVHNPVYDTRHFFKQFTGKDLADLEDDEDDEDDQTSD